MKVYSLTEEEDGIIYLHAVCETVERAKAEAELLAEEPLTEWQGVEPNVGAQASFGNTYMIEEWELLP